jgi:hypothetical protein
MTGLPNSCGRCGNHWSGNTTSHCGACHRTFTAPSAFDRHRRGGACLDPATVGMTTHERGYTAWGYPSDDANTERLHALRGTA